MVYFNNRDTAVLQHRSFTFNVIVKLSIRKTKTQLHNFVIFNLQMAVYCHYLRLLNILVFIWSSYSMQYGEFAGQKYIILDDFSSNNSTFYSSLFDSKGNVDYIKMKEHSRERREAKQDLVMASNSTQFASSAEYEFHGDNHTVAFLHWSGTRSQVQSFTKSYIISLLSFAFTQWIARVLF